MNTYTYSQIPERITISTKDWKKHVDDSVVKHGVKWIHPRYVGEKTNNESNTVNDQIHEQQQNDEENGERVGPNRRKREVNYIWYITYRCHRWGTYRDKVAEGSRIKGGSTGGTRQLQKSSKKLMCPAKLKFTCFKSDPDHVEIVHTGIHNREVGRSDDLKYLPLSQERKNVIMQRLREGFSKRDCRIAIQKDFRIFTRDCIMNLVFFTHNNADSANQSSTSWCLFYDSIYLSSIGFILFMEQ